MKFEQIEQRLLTGIEDLKPHGGRRKASPHKPLLLLWAVRRRLDHPDASRLFPYSLTETPMRQLLAIAGSTTPPRPWYPYVRLRSSDLWELRGDLPLNPAGDAASVTALRARGVEAGFRSDFDPVLLDPQHARSIEDRIATRWLDPAVTPSVMAALDQLDREE